MQRQNQSGADVDEHPAAKIYALLHQRLHFAAQAVGIDDRSGADHAFGFGIEDAGGHRVENIFVPFQNYRVPGIGPTLTAGHHIGVRAQKIDDFGLALIAPHAAQHR